MTPRAWSAAFAATMLLCSFAAHAEVPNDIDALLAKADTLTSQQVRKAGAAIPIYQQAIRLARKRNDSARLARGHTGLGNALIRLHDQKGARDEFEEARQIANQAGLAGIEAEALVQLGALNFEEGRIEEAERCAREAGTIAAKHGLVGLELSALNLRAAILRRVGRTAAAIETGREALSRLDDAQQRRAAVPNMVLFQIPYNYGRALIENGQYSHGFALLDRALKAATESRSMAGMWHVLEDTADWYREQNDYARADRYYQRALAQGKRIESRDPEGLTRLGMARLDRARGRLTDAEQQCLAAIELLGDAGLTSDLPEALLELSRIQSAAGNTSAAAASVARALGLAAAIGMPVQLTLARIELARIERHAGRPERAEANALAAVELARGNGLRPILPPALNELAVLALDRGDLETAERRFEQSVAAIETLRTGIASPQQRIALAEGSHAAYAGLLEVRMRMHRREPSETNAARALQVVERERAATPFEAGAGPGTRELDARIANLQWTLNMPGLNRPRRTSLLRELDDAERKREAVEAAAHDPRTGSRVVDVAGLQRALQPGEILLEYAASLSSGVVHAITREHVRQFEISSPAGVAARSAFFTTLLCSGRGAEALPAGSRLSRELLVPALHHAASSTRRIFVAAAGELAALPFAALPYPPGGGRPLVAAYEVVYVPSLAALARVRARGERSDVLGTGLLAFSNPAAGAQISRVDLGSMVDLRDLPYSESEIRSIGRLVERRDVLEGAAASEAALKSRPVASYQILHFATHAVLDPISPRRSAVILARGSDDEDGLLQPRDIGQLRLGGQLVILSGCETSAGRTSSVEGALSLARAFLFAGATAVVGTLADVEDRSSAELVVAFYQRLARGETVGSALRGAQLTVAGSRPYETAALWAPWIVSGDGTMRVDIGRRRPSALIWISISILAAGAVVVYCLKCHPEPFTARALRLRE